MPDPYRKPKPTNGAVSHDQWEEEGGFRAEPPDWERNPSDEPFDDDAALAEIAAEGTLFDDERDSLLPPDWRTMEIPFAPDVDDPAEKG
ncbi:MAG: hypothetical protein ACRC1H_05880, partial [Caldilineaceae bacterium]